jgi:rhamnogalacturonyl hydrolase YesR
MSNALVTYWFAEVMPGGYPFDYSIDQVCEFLEYLELLQKTSKEEYQDLFENTLTLSIFETAEKIQRNIGGHGE